jgi:hypothetical protein
MTDYLEETHAQIAFSLLAANPNIPLVFDEKVPDPTPTPPYVVVKTQVEWTRDGIGTGLDAVQDTITTTWTCHCAGLTPAAARAVGGQVRSSLLNAQPFIANRICGPIKAANTPEPPVRDESTGRLVEDWVLQFGFMSTG